MTTATEPINRLPAAQNGQTQRAEIVERVMLLGDLSKLSAEERVSYYLQMCHSLGLNPLTKPFDYLNLGGKLVLYARKDATDQLRKIHGVSIVQLETKSEEGTYTVTAHAKDDTGREDCDIGVVPIANLKADFLANAKMKATTKAKRRVTLSICGLGMMDESETDSLPDAKPVAVDHQTGEIIDAPKSNGHKPKTTVQDLVTRAAKIDAPDRCDQGIAYIKGNPEYTDKEQETVIAALLKRKGELLVAKDKSELPPVIITMLDYLRTCNAAGYENTKAEYATQCALEGIDPEDYRQRFEAACSEAEKRLGIGPI